MKIAFSYIREIEELAKVKRDVEHWEKMVGQEKLAELKHKAMTTVNSYYDLLEKEVDNMIRKSHDRTRKA